MAYISPPALTGKLWAPGNERGLLKLNIAEQFCWEKDYGDKIPQSMISKADKAQIRGLIF